MVTQSKQSTTAFRAPAVEISSQRSLCQHAAAPQTHHHLAETQNHSPLYRLALLHLLAPSQEEIDPLYVAEVLIHLQEQ